eukprot:TRINITY_DN4616_c0_g1_i1.p1 TRINITY_DN4616_c0_g1~~TRINITY_DN4616_c0_g1_i1.p1  ORF type:complete len:1440 (-),score=517.76 TRINITY_DN4616_c0_g1_i1:179-4498(-)
MNQNESESSEPFAFVSIKSLEALNLSHKLNPYYVIHINGKKFNSDSKRSPSKWQCNINFEILEEENLNEEVKITIWSLNKLKKDKLIGECSIPFKELLSVSSSNILNSTKLMSDLVIPTPEESRQASPFLGTASPLEAFSPVVLRNLNTHAASPLFELRLGDTNFQRSSMDQHEIDSEFQFPTIEVPLRCKEKKKKKKRENGEENLEISPKILMSIDANGWKIMNKNMEKNIFTLSDFENIRYSLEKLNRLAESKGNSNRKVGGYIKRKLLNAMTQLAINQSVPIDISKGICQIWGKFLRRDDESLLLMVKEGILEFYSNIIKNLEKSEVLLPFLEIMKSFFKYVSHQKELVNQGILERLIQLIGKDDFALQIKAFDVLLHFDAVHGVRMIQVGILPQLSNLIQKCDNSQVQTRALALIQYFDVEQQEDIIKEGIMKDLVGLLGDKDHSQIQLKTMSVLQHFDEKHQELMVKEGVLKHLVDLIGSQMMSLRLKAFEVMQSFVKNHQKMLISEGLIDQLLELAKRDEEDQETRLQSISLLSLLDPNETIPKGFLGCVSQFLASENQILQFKAFDIIISLKSHHESVSKLGLLTQILEFLVVPIPVESESLESEEASENSKEEEKEFAEKEEKLETDSDKSNELDSVAPSVTSTDISMWNCRRCTWLNNKTDGNCVVCLAPKPNGFSLENASDGGATLETYKAVRNAGYEDENVSERDSEMESTTLNNEWACLQCTFINHIEATNCDMCGGLKPAGSNRQNQTAINAPNLPLTRGGRENAPNPFLEVEEGNGNITNSSPFRPLMHFGGGGADLSVPNFFRDEETEKSVEAPSSPPLEVREDPTKESKYSVEQRIKSMEVLRSFDVEYQQEMIDFGLISYLMVHLYNSETEFQVIRLISHLDSKFHPQMIEQGMIQRLIQLVTVKNVKVFLLVIQRFEGYQQEIMKEASLLPLIKLRDADISVQSRISDFILGFDKKHWRAIRNQLKLIVNPNSNGVCPACEGISGHLTHCQVSKMKLSTKKIFSANSSNAPQYSLQQQAKKLLFQLENHGLGLLKYKLIFGDGGETGKKHRAKNILQPDFSVYSSEKESLINLSLEYVGRGDPLLTHIVVKVPSLKYESPLRTAVFFTSKKPIDVKLTSKYDHFNESQWKELVKKNADDQGLEGGDEFRAIAYVDMSESESDLSRLLTTRSYKEIPLENSMIAPYILVKLLTATKKNYEVEFLGFIGTSFNASEGEKPPSITPKHISEPGNNLGVKKRVKKFEYVSDFDKNGLLFWIGTSEGEKLYTNPLVAGQVRVTTSHNMYSTDMRVEEIIGRSRGSSCYWGGSSPQWFILDLKHRRLRCNGFTLRHGYQASNSFIQDWEFSASNDGVHWTVLFKCPHPPFRRPFDTKSWPILDGQEYFRYFKITQRGNYSMGIGTTGGGSAFLCIAGFELYGDLLMD